MTLSILIPTFEYDAHVLVDALCHLVEEEGVDAEIFVGDDASQRETAWLDALASKGTKTAVPDAPSSKDRVRVLRYERNAGRAAHRNRMAEEAQGDYLLFIDCDARVEDDFSLRRYLEATAEAPVVCGGLRTPAVNPCPEASLRYAYELAADRHRSAQKRNQYPYSHLTTFSLLVQRSLFLSVRFDESCMDYGYEDALFGVELQQRHIPIAHIDNPLVHLGMEPNDIFLTKTETALRTLKGLQGRMAGHSHVENAALHLQRWHLAPLFRLFFRLFQAPLRSNLLGPHPNLSLFSLYKLSYFLTLDNPHNP